MKEVGEKFADVSTQFVDLDKVPGSRFLFLAALNALKSIRSDHPISKTLSMEILLYTSARRQITEAVRLVGITPDTRRIAVFVVGQEEPSVASAVELVSENVGGASDDSILDDWSPTRIRNVRSIFGVGTKELEATLKKDESVSLGIQRLAIEKSALLTIRK